MPPRIDRRLFDQLEHHTSVMSKTWQKTALHAVAGGLALLTLRRIRRKMAGNRMNKTNPMPKDDRTVG